jgi:hypothetical protein
MLDAIVAMKMLLILVLGILWFATATADVIGEGFDPVLKPCIKGSHKDNIVEQLTKDRDRKTLIAMSVLEDQPWSILLQEQSGRYIAAVYRLGSNRSGGMTKMAPISSIEKPIPERLAQILSTDVRMELAQITPLPPNTSVSQQDSGSIYVFIADNGLCGKGALKQPAELETPRGAPDYLVAPLRWIASYVEMRGGNTRAIEDEILMAHIVSNVLPSTKQASINADETPRSRAINAHVKYRQSTLARRPRGAWQLPLKIVKHYVSDNRIVGEVCNYTNRIVDNLKVRATLYDKAGMVVRVVRNDSSQSVPPNSKEPFEIFDPQLRDRVSSYTLQVVEGEFRDERHLPRLSFLQIDNVSFVQDATTLTIRGLVKNPNNFRVGDVSIGLLFYDKSGRVFEGQRSRLDREISSGAKTQFDMTFDKSPGVDFFEVRAIGDRLPN